jgi:hypothetical protein
MLLLIGSIVIASDSLLVMFHPEEKCKKLSFIESWWEKMSQVAPPPIHNQGLVNLALKSLKSNEWFAKHDQRMSH